MQSKRGGEQTADDGVMEVGGDAGCVIDNRNVGWRRPFERVRYSFRARGAATVGCAPSRTSDLAGPNRPAADLATQARIVLAALGPHAS